MKTRCPPGYHHNGLVATYALGHMNRKKTFCLKIAIFPYVKQLFQAEDTHREKAPSNKTPALAKSTNMGIWVVGT